LHGRLVLINDGEVAEVLHRGCVREGEGHGVSFRWLALAYHGGLTLEGLNVSTPQSKRPGPSKSKDQTCLGSHSPQGQPWSRRTPEQRHGC
jgi:hypothetical protein